MKNIIIRISAAIFCAILVILLSGCGKDSWPFQSGTASDTELAPEVICDVTEGLAVDETISDTKFKISLPKVIHSSNSEISIYYDNLLNMTNEYLDLQRSRTNGYDNLMYEEHRGYVTATSGDLASLNVYTYRWCFGDQPSWQNVEGLVFDNSGRIYTMDETARHYGTALMEIEAALRELEMSAVNQINQQDYASEEEYRDVVDESIRHINSAKLSDENTVIVLMDDAHMLVATDAFGGSSPTLHIVSVTDGKINLEYVSTKDFLNLE